MTRKAVIVDVDRLSEQTFRVKKGEHLTLALIARSPKQKEAHFTVRLMGHGAKATIVGLIFGKNSDEFSLHTLQIHEAAETTSNLLVKSTLTDKAKFHYDGAIRVDPKAQKTDAYQRNENLLLSEAAHAESKPSLEILANDVRCTHGATVGTIPKEELWYLATRGIRATRGVELIARGFVESAIEKISDTIVQQNIRKLLWRTL